MAGRCATFRLKREFQVDCGATAALAKCAPTVRTATQATDFVAKDVARIRNTCVGRFTLDLLMEFLAAPDEWNRGTLQVNPRSAWMSALPLPS